LTGFFVDTVITLQYGDQVTVVWENGNMDGSQARKTAFRKQLDSRQQPDQQSAANYAEVDAMETRTVSR
jgi:hypothetical protein